MPVNETDTARRALYWIEENLGVFAEFGAEGYCDEWQCTALAEFAFAYRALPTSTELISAQASMQRAIAYCFQKPVFHEGLFSSWPGGISVLVAWILLYGQDDTAAPITRRQIQSYLDTGALVAQERKPYRLLELAYILNGGGFQHPLPSPESFLPFLTLGQSVSPVACSDDDAYAITHALFYLTDFGKNTLSLSLAREQELQSLLTMLLGRYIHTRNWDIVAELVMVRRFLFPDDSYWVPLAWEGLTRAQNRDGAITGICSAEDADSDFSIHYHPTLMTALAHFAPRRVQ